MKLSCVFLNMQLFHITFYYYTPPKPNMLDFPQHSQIWTSILQLIATLSYISPPKLVSSYSCCCLVTTLCLTLCNPMNCSLLDSSVHGVSQTRILEWLAIPISKGSSQPEIQPRSPAFQADFLLSELPGKSFS